MTGEPLTSLPERDLWPDRGIRFASVYAGCGGLDLGFAAAGFAPTWANDLDPVALRTHASLIGAEAIAGDIDDVPWPERGSADVVVGGPPCQGFSVAGKMDPLDPRSRHVSRFFDFVEHVGPEAFVMENVKALAVNKRWQALVRGLEARAHRLGYSTRLALLNSADFGVPQRRERMFLIGVRGADPTLPTASHAGRHVTVRDALESLPPCGTPGNDTICTARVTPAKRPILRPSPWRGALLFNGNGRPLQLSRPAPTLPASMGGNATPIIDERELATGEESWVVAYHADLLRGGRPERTAPAELRRITVEEATRLQSFPDGTPWHGTTSARFRQLGNSVPPLLAYHVARAVASALQRDDVQLPQVELVLAGAR